MLCAIAKQSDAVSHFACGIADEFIVGIPTFFMVLLAYNAPNVAELVGPAGAFVGFIASALLSQLRQRK